MSLLIGIVGVCKSGKSLLKKGLEKNGYTVRHIAQEHSFSPTMWKKISNPDILIYLEADFETTVERGQNWKEKDFFEQLDRLRHARSSADIFINTVNKSPDEVLEDVLFHLQS